MSTRNNRTTHKKAVLHVAQKLIENGIVTRNAKVAQSGVDLVLNNGKTIAVKGSNTERRIPVSHDPECKFDADYVVIATNLKYTYHRRLYVMKANDVVKMAENCPVKSTNLDNWFINIFDYRTHEKEYDALVE